MFASLVRLGAQARERWRGALLTALLAVLHLSLLAGASATAGLMGWLTDVGLFLLWQPFFRAERRLNYGNLLLIGLALGAGGWFYGDWLLLVWVAFLAALLGGRVMLINHRPTRVFYLLAFAYLVGAALFWLVPRIVPDRALVGLSLETPFAWGAPLLLAGMLLIPLPQEPGEIRRGVFDFFYAVFIFLLLSVLVLGSLAFMLLAKLLYYEALFRTVISMALLLLLVAWAWNPRPGFSGVGVFFSQYVLTLGLPFDSWLRQMMTCAEEIDDPDRFFREIGERLLLDLPWVLGGRWEAAEGMAAGQGGFGRESSYPQVFLHRPLRLTVYARHTLSPVLVWHLQLLTRLACEYYLAKWRARDLQQMSYMRAIHETGARVTHEVKNLLQSLDNLCYAAEHADAADGERLQRMVQRQLPQIGRRLHATLDRLQPVAASGKHETAAASLAAREWWESLCQRFPQSCIRFVPVECAPDVTVPSFLFDSVVDNLLHNALTKQQQEESLQIVVSLSPDAQVLRVCDDGSPLAGDLSERLFAMPVPSSYGFGIGLFNAARQAALLGYTVRLARNEPGGVCFELAWHGRQ